MIRCKKEVRQGEPATLFVASDNAAELPAQMMGAVALGGEPELSDADFLADVNLLIATAGVTLESIRGMGANERNGRAGVIAGDRTVSAVSVKELALKYGCPSANSTKLSRLKWLFEHEGGRDEEEGETQGE